MRPEPSVTTLASDLGRALTGTVAVLGVLALAGCGSANSNPLGLPTATVVPGEQAALGRRAAPAPAATAPSAGSAAASAAASRLGYVPADPLSRGAWVEVGAVHLAVADRAVQQAVVDAFVGFERVRLQAFNTRKLDRQALGQVAAGDAAADTAADTDARAGRNLYTVGRYVVNVSAVTMTGDRATIAGCALDATSEVDSTGQTAIFPPGKVSWVPTLRRDAGTWKVIQVPKEAAQCA